MDDVLQSAYQAACDAEDENAAADLARKIRNRMLSDSDAEFAFDRFGLDIPENITATNMLSALKSVFTVFRNMVRENWATYRQALRDIPNQPGFPFHIDFPVKPESIDGETNE